MQLSLTHWFNRESNNWAGEGIKKGRECIAFEREDWHQCFDGVSSHPPIFRFLLTTHVADLWVSPYIFLILSTMTIKPTLSCNKGKPFKIWCLLPPTSTKKAITLASKQVQKPVMEIAMCVFTYNSQHHRFLLSSENAGAVQVFWCDFLQFCYRMGYRVQDPNLLSPHFFLLLVFPFSVYV